MKERKNGEGMLLGPKAPDKFLEWRRARDNAIANPRRSKAVQEAEKKAKQDQPGDERA